MKTIHMIEVAFAFCVAFILQITTWSWFDAAVKGAGLLITAVVGVFAILHYIDARKASKTRRELDQMEIDEKKRSLNHKQNGKA